MNWRLQQTRPQLVAVAGIPVPRQSRKPQKKPRRPNPHTVLLRTLREQRQKIAGRAYFERADAPELFDLAMAADRAPQGKPSFIFNGVRFRLKFGFRRYVCDPKTGDFLIGGGLF